MPALRTRNRLGLFKGETTEGVDASPTAGSNAFSSIGLEVGVNPNVIEDNELRGGLGAGDIVVGATPMTAQIRANLRGTGTGGAAVEWDDIWEACGLNPTADATAMPASGATTCTGGTTSTCTFSVTATNWPSSAGLDPTMVGKVVELGGDHSEVVTIESYSVTGSTATITFAQEVAVAPGVSTTVKKPINVIYTPHSGTIPSGTFYEYLDGVLWKVLGCRGDWSMDWTAGGKGTFDARLNGVFGGRSDASVPTPTLPTTQAPIWVNGRMNINRKAVAASQLSIGMNNSGTFPGNPNAAEGLDPYVVTGRSAQGAVNPLMTLTATRDLFADLRGQTVRTIAAILGSRAGGVAAGNRFSLFIANAKFRSYAMADDGGLARESVPFQCQGVNGEFVLCGF